MALSKSYDLILLDIMMPKLDGVEVLKQIRSHKQDVPIIMLTARSDDVSKILNLELGADDFVAKPFNPLELKARIKAVSRRATRVVSHRRQTCGP